MANENNKIKLLHLSALLHRCFSMGRCIFAFTRGEKNSIKERSTQNQNTLKMVLSRIATRNIS